MCIADFQTQDKPGMFSMSGDGVDDVQLPSVFLHQRDGDSLFAAIAGTPHMVSVQGTGCQTGKKLFVVNKFFICCA